MEFLTFFWLLVALSFLDAYTTYKGIKKNQGKEANPIVKAFIKEFGLKDGLLIAKLLYLVYVWFNPITNQTEQLIILGTLALVSVSNYLIANKK